MTNEKNNWHTEIIDRLSRVETKVDNLVIALANHLKHHWEITIAILGISGALAVSLILAIMKIK